MESASSGVALSEMISSTVLVATLIEHGLQALSQIASTVVRGNRDDRERFLRALFRFPELGFRLDSSFYAAAPR